MAGSDADLTFALLGRRHNRTDFTCGVESLDQYLRTQARQDVRRKANGVFIMASQRAPSRVLGFYTLCAMTISQDAVPPEARKFVPRYPVVSATLIGRLAVAKGHQGKGLGSVLLADALRRAFLSADTVGSSMVVVDVIDERASEFYAAHGFIRLPESTRLVLPMRVIPALIEDK